MNDENNGRTQNLGEAITARLGAAIIRGDYSIHDQLPTELQLSEHLGVSRGAVREAIKVLAAKGLVTSRRRQGTRVADSREWNLLDPEILNWMQHVEYSHQLLFELVQVRLAIEPEAAAIVARRRDRVDFASMSRALDGLERTDISDDQLTAYDTEFHTRILQATGNRFYQQMTPLLETTLAFGQELLNTVRLFGDQGRVIQADHRHLFELMLDGKSREARRASWGMIVTVRDAVEKALLAQRNGETVAN